MNFYIRDAKNIAACDACVIIGAKGRSVAGINCGACGYTSCEELTKECGQQIFPGQIVRCG